MQAYRGRYKHTVVVTGIPWPLYRYTLALQIYRGRYRHIVEVTGIPWRLQVYRIRYKYPVAVIDIAVTQLTKHRMGILGEIPSEKSAREISQRPANPLFG